MRTCGVCGDNVPDDGHIADGNCWVIQKMEVQENLDPLIASDYAVMRPALTDAEWNAAHPSNL
jgi:hypothetical protein